jgi:hypothetical protein
VNLLSLSALERSKTNKIVYEQKYGRFLVTGKNGVVYEFSNHGGKLYTCDLSKYDNGAREEDTEECYYEALDDETAPNHEKNSVSLMETVAKNQSLFTVKQVEAADRGRVFTAAMGDASTTNMHALVRAGRVEGIDVEHSDITEGIDVAHSDITRLTKIYGPELEAIRAKPTQRKTKFADPVVGKVVQSNPMGYAMMSVYLFFAMLVKHIMMFFCRPTADVNRALDKQLSVVQGEGFIATEVTADGDGALGAMKEELERSGCKITTHAENKIRQAKDVVRNCSCWAILFSTVLTGALVYFAAHKVNTLATRANAHGDSPIEIFPGRPILLWRDLGAKGKRGKPLAFGSRVEMFHKTSNTMADRIRHALFLGSKGNCCGTATLFMLDTRTIVSSDKRKGPPLGAGTIARVNEIARRGPPFLRMIPIYVGGREVSDVDVIESAHDSAMPYGRASFPVRLVADDGHDTPDVSFGDQVDSFSLGIEAARADEAIESRTDFGIAEEQRESAEEIGGETRHDGEAAEIGGATSSSGAEPTAETKYHYPALYSAPEDSSWSGLVGAPWFPAGKPLPITEGRSKRVTKAPSRYGFDDKYVTKTGLLAEVYDLMRKEQSSGVVERVSVRPPTGRNRVQQARLENQREKHFSAFILTIDKAVDQLGDKALESMHRKLSWLHKKSVFTQVLLWNLSDELRPKIISSKMFLKEKFIPRELSDIPKSGLVAGKHMQDRGGYGEEETSSPMARDRRKVGSADVKTAYLKANMGRDVFVKMDRRVSDMLVKLSPNFYKLDADDKVHVKLDKAPYGCVKSAKLWYNKVSADLPPIHQKARDESHSTVMKLMLLAQRARPDMLLAQRARPDILTAVSFLSRRWSKATEEDLGKLTRVLKYLRYYQDIKIVLMCGDVLRVYSYVDASFAVHSDMKSLTGGIVSLGTGSSNVSLTKMRDDLIGYSVRKKPGGNGEASQTSRGAKEFGVSEPLVVKV